MKYAGLLLLFAAGCSAIVSGNTNGRYTAYSQLDQGNSNKLEYSFSGTLKYGEFIGVFTNADLSTATTVCTGLANKFPVVELLPSKDLSYTNNNIPQTKSPQETSSFGSLSVTGTSPYGLCHCDGTSSSGCDYTKAVYVGQLFVVDVAPINYAFTYSNGGKLSITLQSKTASRFSTYARGGAGANTVDASDSLILIPATGQCGYTGTTFTSNNFDLQTRPATVGNVAPVTLSNSGKTFSQVVTLAGTVIASGSYKLCLCLGATACPAYANTDVANAGNANGAARHSFQVGSVFVHDLKFDDASVVKSVLKSTSGSTTAEIGFTYSGTVLVSNNLQNTFWLTAAGVACGDGSHSAATPHMTKAYPFKATYTLAIGYTVVDLSSLVSTTQLHRVCYAKRAAAYPFSVEQVYDLSNVGVRLLDLVVTPLAPARSFGKNYPVHLAFSTALSPGDHVFFATDCTSQAVLTQRNPAVYAAASKTSTQAVLVSRPGLYFFDFSGILVSKQRVLFKTCVLRASAPSVSAIDQEDLGTNLHPADVSAFVPHQGDAANEGKGYTVTVGGLRAVAIDLNFGDGFDTGVTGAEAKLWFKRATKPCGDRVKEDASGTAQPQDGTPVVTFPTHATAGTAVDVNVDFSSIQPSSDLFRLCVRDVIGNVNGGAAKVYDFPTAALSVMSVTGSPTAFYYTPPPSPQSPVTVPPTPQFFPDDASSTPTPSQYGGTTLTWSFSGALSKGDRLGFVNVVGLKEGATTEAYVKCGQALSKSTVYFSVSAGVEGSAGKAESGVLPGGLSDGRYLVCYCNSGYNTATSVAQRDCQNPEHWSYQVGYYTSTSADPALNRLAAPIDGSNPFQIDIRVPQPHVNDRFMLIPYGNVCGSVPDNQINIRAVTPAVIAASVLYDTDNSAMIGLHLSATFASAGHFSVCMCRSQSELGGACPTASSEGLLYPQYAFGARVGSLVVHDVKLQSFTSGGYNTDVTTRRLSVIKSPSTAIFFKYGQSPPSGSRAFWAWTGAACGSQFAQGTASTQNATVDVFFPASGTVANFDFSQLRSAAFVLGGLKNCPIYRLCVAVTGTSGRTYMDYSDVRIQLRDGKGITLKGSKIQGVATAQALHRTFDAKANAGAANNIRITGGDCELSLGEQSYIWFQSSRDRCGTFGANDPNTATADQGFSFSKYYKIQNTESRVLVHDITSDFRGVNLFTNYHPFRVCACQRCGTHAAAQVAAATRNYKEKYMQERFWDFPHLVVWPVNEDCDIVISKINDNGGTQLTTGGTGAVLAGVARLTNARTQTNDRIVFADTTAGNPVCAGGSAAKAPLQDGQVAWFRRGDQPCGGSADDATAGGAATASAQVTITGSGGWSSATPSLWPGSTANGYEWNLSNLQANQWYRLCVKASNADVFEFENAQIVIAATAPTVATTAATSSPTTAAASITNPGGALFTLKHLTIEPTSLGTKSASTAPLEAFYSWTSAKLLNNFAISNGDRLGFVDVKSSGLVASCNAIAAANAAPVFEGSFSSHVSTYVGDITSVLPRLPVGVYYSCYCQKDNTCGNGVTQWIANGDVGMLVVVDAPILQTVVYHRYNFIGVATPATKPILSAKLNSDHSARLDGSQLLTPAANQVTVNLAAGSQTSMVALAAGNWLMHHTDPGYKSTVDAKFFTGMPYIVTAYTAATNGGAGNAVVTATGVTATAAVTSAKQYMSSFPHKFFLSAKDANCGAAAAANHAFAPSYFTSTSVEFWSNTASDAPTAVGEYSVCFCRSSTLGSSTACPASNGAALFNTHGVYGQLGKLFVHDLKLTYGNYANGWGASPDLAAGTWGHAINPSLLRQDLSLNKPASALRVTVTSSSIGTAASSLFNTNTDWYWFLPSDRSCCDPTNLNLNFDKPCPQDVADSLPTWKTDQDRFKPSGQTWGVMSYGKLSENLVSGAIVTYRMCVWRDMRSQNKPSIFRSLDNLFTSATDVTVTPKAPVLHTWSLAQDAFKIRIASTSQLVAGDYFWFARMDQGCPSNLPLTFPTATNFFQGAEYATNKVTGTVRFLGGNRDYVVHTSHTNEPYYTWRLCVAKSNFDGESGLYSWVTSDLGADSTQISPVRQFLLTPSVVGAWAQTQFAYRAPVYDIDLATTPCAVNGGKAEFETSRTTTQGTGLNNGDELALIGQLDWADGDLPSNGAAGTAFLPVGPVKFVQHTTTNKFKIDVVTGASAEAIACQNGGAAGKYTLAANYLGSPKTTKVYLRKVGHKCNGDSLSGTGSINAFTPGSLPVSTVSTTSTSFLSSSDFAKIGGGSKIVNLQNKELGKYRLCLHLGSGSNTAQGYVDLDTAEVEISNLATLHPTAQVSSPTAFNYFSPTPAGSVTSVSSSQSFTFNSVSYAGDSPRVIKWSFAGTVKPGDMLALGSKSLSQCTGNFEPELIFAASNSTVDVTGTATSGFLASLPAGKYRICYCSSQSAFQGMCNDKGAFRQPVGWVTFFDADTNQTASATVGDATAGFSVTLGHPVKSSDRVMVIQESGVCGRTAPDSLTNSFINGYPTVSNTNQLNIPKFNKTAAGIFSICYCRADDQLTGVCTNDGSADWLPSFGGKIGTLVVSDVLLNGNSYATVDVQTKTASLQITQSLFSFDEDMVWFAEGTTACGNGGHSDGATLTYPVKMSKQIAVNFAAGGKTTSWKLWKMCIKVAKTGTVYSLGSAGVFYHDVKLNPLSGPEQFNPYTGRQGSTTTIRIDSGNTFTNGGTTAELYWLHPSIPCYNELPSSLTTTLSTPDSSNYLAFTNSFGSYQFKFDLTKANRAYRLCAGMGGANTGNPVKRTYTSVVDMNTVMVYTVSSDVALQSQVIVQSSGKVFITDSNNTFTAAMKGDDVLWFARRNQMCSSSPPSASGEHHSASFKWSSKAWVARDVTQKVSGITLNKNVFSFSIDVSKTNAAKVNNDDLFRLCVHTASGEKLDWSRLFAGLTTMKASNSACLKHTSQSQCMVQLSWSNFLTTSSDVWYQDAREPLCRFSTDYQDSNSHTLSTNWANAVRTSERKLQVTNTATEPLYLSKGKLGAANKMRLCTRSLVTLNGRSVYAVGSFLDIELILHDIVLWPTNPWQSTRAVLASSSSTVRVMYSRDSIYDAPNYSKLWFQAISDSTCTLPGSSGTNVSSGVVDTSKYVAVSANPQGYNFTVDFSSLVTPAGGNMVPLRLCMGLTNKADSTKTDVWDLYSTISANYNLKLEAFRFDVSPQKVVKGSAVAITVKPRAQISSMYFRQVGSSCLPRPSGAGGSDHTQLVVPSSDVSNFNFSAASKSSVDYRLCAVLKDVSDVVDAAEAKVFLACQDAGVSGANCDQCGAGFFNSAAAGLTCTSCGTVCNDRSVSCTHSANNTGVCTCTGNFDPSKACASCLPGYLQKDSVCVATQSPTKKPTMAPTSPTPKPTTKPTTVPTTASPTTTPPTTAAPTAAAPTASTGCSGVDSQPSKCRAWAQGGFCQNAQYSSYMNANCPRSCCEHQNGCKNSHPDLSQCDGWASANYCADKTYGAWMTEKCSWSCGICTTTAGCKNSHPDSSACDGWASANYCADKTYGAWMTENCACSCSSDSVQYASSCSSWKTSGYCESTAGYYEFMKQHCRKTCGF